LKWTVVSSPSSSYDAPVHSRFFGDDGRASPRPQSLEQGNLGTPFSHI